MSVFVLPFLCMSTVAAVTVMSVSALLLRFLRTAAAAVVTPMAPMSVFVVPTTVPALLLLRLLGREI